MEKEKTFKEYRDKKSKERLIKEESELNNSNTTVVPPAANSLPSAQDALNTAAQSR
jgi:hypothetical protein